MKLISEQSLPSRGKSIARSASKTAARLCQQHCHVPWHLAMLIFIHDWLAGWTRDQLKYFCHVFRWTSVLCRGSELLCVDVRGFSKSHFVRKLNSIDVGNGVWIFCWSLRSFKARKGWKMCRLGLPHKSRFDNKSLQTPKHLWGSLKVLAYSLKWNSQRFV